MKVPWLGYFWDELATDHRLRLIIIVSVTMLAVVTAAIWLILVITGRGEWYMLLLMLLIIGTMAIALRILRADISRRMDKQAEIMDRYNDPENGGGNPRNGIL